jgi:hypothetical protein
VVEGICICTCGTCVWVYKKSQGGAKGILISYTQYVKFIIEYHDDEGVVPSAGNLLQTRVHYAPT